MHGIAFICAIANLGMALDSKALVISFHRCCFLFLFNLFYVLFLCFSFIFCLFVRLCATGCFCFVSTIVAIAVVILNDKPKFIKKTFPRLKLNENDATFSSALKNNTVHITTRRLQAPKLSQPTDKPNCTKVSFRNTFGIYFH